LQHFDPARSLKLSLLCTVAIAPADFCKRSIEIVQDTLTEGEEIVIVNFGSLSVAERKGRTGRNPKTGEPVEIPPSFITVRFKIGKAFKELINS